MFQSAQESPTLVHLPQYNYQQQPLLLSRVYWFELKLHSHCLQAPYILNTCSLQMVTINVDDLDDYALHEFLRRLWKGNFKGYYHFY